MAEIHPRLIADCIPLVRLPLCHLLLMNDSNFPWFILVPDREGIREIYQLEDADRAFLFGALRRFEEPGCVAGVWRAAVGRNYISSPI